MSLKNTHFSLKNTPFLWCLEADSATRAYVSTGTTLRADVRINRIVFTFRDSTHRALIDTRTACDTIGRNFVSHSFNIYDLTIYDVRFIYDLVNFSIDGAKIVLFFDTTKFLG